MTAIWKRELKSYFSLAVGFVFMGVFLCLTSVIFYLQILSRRSGDLLSFMGQISYLWMLLSPVLTMRLLAEGRQSKTDQLLFTSPVSPTKIVLGKFLAAVTVMGLTLALTLFYVAVMALYGTVYPGEVFVGYLGTFLQGCAFIALDMMVSSLTRSQVTACAASFGVNFLLWIADMLDNSITSPIGSGIINFVSLYARNEPFLMGQLSIASVCYDVTFALLMLIVTVHILDSRRWRGV